MKVRKINRRPGHGSHGPDRILKNPPQVPCSHCRAEVPRSAAINPEAEDYALYFCGLQCYRQWLTTHGRERSRLLDQRLKKG
jgi:hypothetical protein